MAVLQSFFDCVVDIFAGVVEIFQTTDFGAFTFENVIVGTIVVSMVVRVVVVRFGGED